jgi:hypothetical protein
MVGRPRALATHNESIVQDTSVEVVPEPSATVLIALALLVLAIGGSRSIPRLHAGVSRNNSPASFEEAGQPKP